MISAKLINVFAIWLSYGGLGMELRVLDTPKPFAAEQQWMPIQGRQLDLNAAPAFTPDGATVYFTHAEGERRTIMVSHRYKGSWSPAKAASFSGTWRDIEPVMAPDGSYLLFISNRPATNGGAALDGFFGGAVRPGQGGNLWRVNWTKDHWSEPIRLPDVINGNSAIYSPAVAKNGNIYFAQPDPITRKTRLYRSRLVNGQYTQPEPLSFSNGVISDYDPCIAPDESFVVFSSPRSPTPKDQSGIFVTFYDGRQWQTPVPFEPFLSGIECRFSSDLKTLYFTSSHPTSEPSAVMQVPSAEAIQKPKQLIWQVPLRIAKERAHALNRAIQNHS